MTDLVAHSSKTHTPGLLQVSCTCHSASPLLDECCPVELPRGAFLLLQLLSEDTGQRDKGGVEEVHGKLGSEDDTVLISLRWQWTCSATQQPPKMTPINNCSSKLIKELFSAISSIKFPLTAICSLALQRYLAISSRPDRKLT